VLVWLGTLRRRATAACADAERTRGVAWLEPRLQAKISYSDMNDSLIILRNVSE